MINAAISLVLTLAIAATLGSQFASAAYRETSVRALLASQHLPAVRSNTIAVANTTPS